MHNTMFSEDVVDDKISGMQHSHHHFKVVSFSVFSCLGLCVSCNTPQSVSVISVLMLERNKGNTFHRLQHFMIGRFSVVGYQRFTLSILLEILH